MWRLFSWKPSQLRENPSDGGTEYTRARQQQHFIHQLDKSHHQFFASFGKSKNFQRQQQQNLSFKPSEVHLVKCYKRKQHRDSL